VRPSPRPFRPVVVPPCPPDCWTCELAVSRPPATPLTTAVAAAVVDGVRRYRTRVRGTRADGGGRPGGWPLTAWWEETLR
jgi:hypothetical protein